MSSLSLLKFVFLLCPLFLSAQKTEVSGNLFEFNSKYETGIRRLVANAMVVEELGRSNPVVTGIDGFFKLELISIPVKSSLRIAVSKQGWEVVNSDMLNMVADQSEPVKLYLSPVGRIAENKRQYYKIGKSEGEKYLETRLAQTKAELARVKQMQQKDTAKIRMLNDELSKLAYDQVNFERNLVEVVNRLAYINLDEANKRSLQAFDFFNKGNISKALELLDIKILERESKNYDSLDRKGEQLIAIGDSLKQVALEGRNRLAEDYMLGASLAVIQSDYTKAYLYYKGAIKERPLNPDYKTAFANFLIDQKNFNEAIVVTKQIINQTKEPKYLVKAQVDMGNLLRIMRSKESIQYYYKALLLSDSLSSKESLHFKGVALNGLGNVYFQVYLNSDSAEVNFLKGYQIKKLLLSVDSSEQHFHEVLKTALNLVAVYSETRKCNEGDQYATFAIKEYEKLSVQKPLQYSYYYAMALTNYSMLLRHCNRHQEGIKQLERAVLEYEKLSKKNPEAYQPDLSLAFVNMGSLYDDLGDYNQAEKYARKAYEIRKKYFSIYPDAYAELLALATINLAKAVHFGHENKSLANRKKASDEMLYLLGESRENLKRYNTGIRGKQFQSQIEGWISRYKND